MAEFVQSLNTLQKDASIRKWIDNFIDTITSNASFCLDHNHLYEYAYTPNGNQELFQLKCKQCVISEKLSGADLMLLEDYLEKNKTAINDKFNKLKSELREPTPQDKIDYMNVLADRIKKLEQNHANQVQQKERSEEEKKAQSQLEQLRINYEQRMIAMSAQSLKDHKYLHDDYMERKERLREIIMKPLQNNTPEQKVYQLQEFNRQFFDNIHANI